MLSKFVLKLMRKTIDDGFKWGCLPFQWDENKPGVIIAVNNSPTRKFLLYFNVAVYTLYIVFLTEGFVQRKLDGSGSEMRLLTEYTLMIYILPLVMRGCILLKYEELADFINSFVPFFQALEEAAAEMTVTPPSVESLGETQQEPVTMDKALEQGRLLTVFLTAGSVIKGLDVLTALWHPERDYLLTRFLLDPSSSVAWQLALLLIPHIYIWWTTWAVLNFLMVYILSYVRATVLTIMFAK